MALLRPCGPLRCLPATFVLTQLLRPCTGFETLLVTSHQLHPRGEAHTSLSVSRKSPRMDFTEQMLDDLEGGHPEVTRRLASGQQRLPTLPRPRTYALLVVPTAGGVFKDAALRGSWPRPNPVKASTCTLRIPADMGRSPPLLAQDKPQR